MMKDLDLLTVDLDKRLLIEASAGTGKTFAIEHIYLRLITEKGLSVDKILVVTFTNAATDELKGRIRSKLKSACTAFETGQAEENDTFLKEYIKSKGDDWTGRARSALLNFDESVICTIHSFCAKILDELSFEASSPFESELIKDDGRIRNEIIEDFWRSTFYESLAREAVEYLLHSNIDLEYLKKASSDAGRDTFLIPDEHEQAPDLSLLDSFKQCFKKCRNSWDANIIREIFDESRGNLDGRQYRNLDKLLEKMDEFIKSEASLVFFHKSAVFDKFCANRIPVKTGRPRPKHDFFDACEELKALGDELIVRLDRYKPWLAKELALYMRKELPLRLERSGLISFDGVLEKLRDAINAKGGDGLLARSIRSRFGAALIDEFQDTDKVQYEIFDTAFSSMPLFMIGDPKQAIYSFRKADIFTYRQAGKDSDAEYTLKENYRSSPAIIKAVNRVFEEYVSGHPPFKFDWIKYNEAVCATKNSDKEGAFELWLVDKNASDPLGHDDAKRIIKKALKNEIIAILNDANENIRPQDIAILLRTNRECREIAEELSAASIPNVVLGTESVFNSEEAKEVLFILNAVAAPDKRNIRSAMAGSIIGAGIREITDGSALEDCFLKFQMLSSIWKTSGFMKMFRKLLNEYRVRERLVQRTNGERSLTNILHVAEILNMEESSSGIRPEHLAKFLKNKMDSEDAQSEDYEMRLQSDSECISIMTMHKSKGLGFEVVFCPFGFSSLMTKEGMPARFHSEEDAFRPCVDFGWTNYVLNFAAASREELAEHLRLVYVSLTRAKRRCYLGWGWVKKVEDCALFYLLHSKRYATNSGLAASYKEFRKDLERLEENGAVTIKELYSSMPAASRYDFKTKELEIDLQPSSEIRRSWTFASYSSIASKRSADEPDYDAEYHVSGQSAFVPDSIFSLPKGAGTGIAIHSILEQIDYSSPIKEIRDAVSSNLRLSGIDERWTESLSITLYKILNNHLGDSGVVLADLRQKDRINEMQFSFPVSMTGIDALVRNFNLEDISNEQDKTEFEKGFIKGFIDMIFRFNGRYYILDWKSNHLGDSLSDYSDESMENAIKSHSYDLQYMLYSLALKKMLAASNISEGFVEIFGGILYVFIRGFNAEKKTGVYFRKPLYSEIANLEKILGRDPS